MQRDSQLKKQGADYRMRCNSRPDSRLPGFLQKALGTMAFVSLCFAGINANAVPVSFGDFYTAPGAPVVISSDGSSATLSEDPGFFAVALSNVPGFGDPQLILPQNGTILSFSYSFSEPVGNDDVFHVALLDGLTGSVLDPAFEAFFADTSAGLIKFDLSSLVGMTLGLQIELVAGLGDGSFDSILQLSNLDLTVHDTEPPTPVLEPSGVVLFAIALGLLGLSLLLPDRRRMMVQR